MAGEPIQVDDSCWPTDGGGAPPIGRANDTGASQSRASQDQSRLDRRERERLARGQRLEGQAMLALADAAMLREDGPNGQGSPADFRLRWQNEFLKAQQGTFVPFTLAIDTTSSMPRAALVYVRAVPKPAEAAAGAASSRRKPAGRPVPITEYPVDAIFPVELKPDGSHTARVSRGFSIAPGDYDIYVVLRERANPATPKARPRAAVLVERLSVPDYWSGALTTSSIILADRLRVLDEPLTDDELVERPYVVGQNEITPAVDSTFRRSEELVVVFLVYNPAVTRDKRFDIQVEYHFFRRFGTARLPDAAVAAAAHPPEREGERYFNHTDPQRFNPAIMGAQFDPNAGHPVLAGQGIPLAGFEQGDYRLAIRVTDLLSGALVARDVNFTVGS